MPKKQPLWGPMGLYTFCIIGGTICLYLKHRRYKCLGKLRLRELGQTPFIGDKHSTSRWSVHGVAKDSWTSRNVFHMKHRASLQVKNLQLWRFSQPPQLAQGSFKKIKCCKIFFWYLPCRDCTVAYHENLRIINLGDHFISNFNFYFALFSKMIPKISKTYFTIFDIFVAKNVVPTVVVEMPQP